MNVHEIKCLVVVLVGSSFVVANPLINVSFNYLSRLKFSYSSEEESDNKGDVVLYYEDDPELPLYSTVTSGYQASELANILMAENINLQQVCHIQPLGVTKTATFIIDLDDVLFSDLKADDRGTWNANGTKSTYFSMSPSGTVRIASEKPSRSVKSSYYTLTRRYYTHGTYKLF